ncbi:MAG: tetratricopeptide repeat protein [Gemmatimonadaceae bacterium]
MSSTDSQRAALIELRAARSVIDRLDASRHPEELAADLIEAWTQLEEALRSFVGGSALSGQPLIRELRQRQLIDLEQAHCLLELLAVRERVQRADYLPIADDVTVARDAYATVEKHLAAGSAAGAAADEPLTDPVLERGRRQRQDGQRDIEPIPPVLDTTYNEEFGRRSQPWWFLGLIAVALVAAAGVAWYAFGRGGTDHVAAGAELFKAGQMEPARREFEIARTNQPNNASPHIYLGRIARQGGDTALARRELLQAVQLDTGSALARREFGSFLLSQKQYEAARAFYTAAVDRDANDRTAMGFLGCTLVKLGRLDEAMRWFKHAGAGEWDVCVPQTAQPQVAPPPR